MKRCWATVDVYVSAPAQGDGDGVVRKERPERLGAAATGSDERRQTVLGEGCLQG